MGRLTGHLSHRLQTTGRHPSPVPAGRMKPGHGRGIMEAWFPCRTALHERPPMPSPFPGMDPYLENPVIFYDLHHSISVAISRQFNRLLPRPYYVRLTHRRRDRGRFEALTVEVCESRRGYALVTLLEIVPTSSWTCCGDRDGFEERLRRPPEDDANLIVIDLLRSQCNATGLSAASPTTRHTTTVCDGQYRLAVRRGGSSAAETTFRSFGLTAPLPRVAVPLRDGAPDVTLDLQSAFDDAYDGGPYDRGAVDYAEPPGVELDDDERAWVRDRLAAAFPDI